MTFENTRPFALLLLVGVALYEYTQGRRAGRLLQLGAAFIVAGAYHIGWVVAGLVTMVAGVVLRARGVP